MPSFDMEDFYNLLQSRGVPPVVIQLLSWLGFAVMLFLGFYGMGYAQGRFNYIDL